MGQIKELSYYSKTHLCPAEQDSLKKQKQLTSELKVLSKLDPLIFFQGDLDQTLECFWGILHHLEIMHFSIFGTEFLK